MPQVYVCALCGGKNQKTLRSAIRGGVKRRVLQCKKCTLVFLEPKKRETAFYKKDYRKKFGPHLGHGTTPKEVFETYLPFQKFRIEDIRHLLSKEKRLLDVGASSGAFLAAVKPFVKEAIGNEPNEEDARFAKEKGITIIETPIEQNPFPEHSFDIITAFQTLEHIENPVPFLKAIQRALKPDGALVVEVPNRNDWLLGEHKLPGYEEFYYREAHHFYYTPETLERMLAKAGFRGTIQGASYIPTLENQFHWIINDMPQGDAKKVYTTPKAGPERAIDEAYRKIVKDALISESIIFIGQPV